MRYSVALRIGNPTLDYDVLWEALDILRAKPIFSRHRRHWLTGQTPLSPVAVRRFLIQFIRDDDDVVVTPLKAGELPSIQHRPASSA